MAAETLAVWSAATGRVTTLPAMERRPETGP
jgi:hypothetical protein